MKHTYTPRRVSPICDTFFRGWVVCAVASVCIWNSATMIYKASEMQYKQINDTINVNQTLTEYRN